MLIFGLGSGRCGTASLAHLLSAQPQTLVFHELNPSCAASTGAWGAIKSGADELSAISRGGSPELLTIDRSRDAALRQFDELVAAGGASHVGDVAHYYLYYVEELAELFPDAKFIVLKRNREATIDSWIRKTSMYRSRSEVLAARITAFLTRRQYKDRYNHWMDVDEGSKWAKSAVWHKCFPNYAAGSIREALELYYDDYYSRVDKFSEQLGDSLMQVPTEQLSIESTQASLLSWLGYDSSQHVYRSGVLNVA